MPRIFHADAVLLGRIIGIDYHGHLRTRLTDMARRNHHRVELLVIVHANGLHLEHESPGGNSHHAHVVFDHVRVDEIRLHSHLADDIQLVIDLDELAYMESRRKGVVVDADRIALCQQLTGQHAGIVLGREDGVGLRELVQRLLAFIILFVEQRDILLLLLEVVVIVLVVILTGQRVGLRPCQQVIDGGIEHEVHERLIVGQHLTYLLQPVPVGTSFKIGHVLDGVHHLGSTVLLHRAFQHIIVVGSLQVHRPLVLLLGLSQRRVVIGYRLEVVGNLHGLALVAIVADAEFAVIVVHKLTAAVGRTSQQVVEALVILHQVGDDVLLLTFQQVLHLGGVILHVLVLLVRQLIVRQLFLENVATQLLGRERATVLRQRQQFVGAVDLQHHIHLVGLLAGDDLMHVEIRTYRVRLLLAVNLVAVAQPHLPVGKHLSQLLHAEEILALNLIGHMGWIDKYLHRQLVGRIHLLLEAESIYRETHFILRLTNRHPRQLG